MADNDSTLKLCCVCDQHKPLSEFHKQAKAKDGLAYRCKPCQSAAMKASRAKHIDKHRAIERSWRERNAGYMQAYYEQNKDQIKVRVREREARLKVELRPYNAERVMRRNARKLRATPQWASQVAINTLYAEAARLTLETGIAHHVDHVVPLQSKLVCGLHVEHNLQILTRPENQSKGNRWWPDSWS